MFKKIMKRKINQNFITNHLIFWTVSFFTLIHKKLILAATLDFEQSAKDKNVPLADKDLGFVISRLLGVAFILASLLSFFILIFAGINWITSGGNSSQLEQARGRAIWAVIGLIILASTTALFIFLQEILGVTIINFNFIP